MAFEEISDNIHTIGDKAKDYGLSTVEYYKLRAFKSSMKGATSLVHLLVFGSIFLFILFFLSLGAAFIIGNSIGVVSYGFFIVGGFYGVVLLLVIIFGKPVIERKILLKSSELFYAEDELGADAIGEQEVNTEVNTNNTEIDSELTIKEEHEKV